MKLFLLTLASLAGAWTLYHPFPPRVNEWIIALFVTLGIYRELRKLVENEK